MSKTDDKTPKKTLQAPVTETIPPAEKTVAEKPTGEKPAGEKPLPVAQPKEIGGPTGPEPTRYGDWERNGRVSDF